VDLERIVAHKRELWALPPGFPAPRVERHRPLRPGLFTAAVSGDEVGIVASVAPAAWRAAAAYEAGGAAAVSVPADELLFGGGPDLVRRVAAEVDVPVLFSDVVVDVRQVDMAYACGADAVRVVVAAVDDAELADILAVADGLGLDALVSAAGEADVARALDAGAEVLGLGHAAGPRVPVPAVLEDGPRDRADVERLAELGFTGCVVGADLLAASDPAAAVRRLTGVVR
jgi:indole-3-glycerol phosphate synthase